jgi:hypothetical protein
MKNKWRFIAHTLFIWIMYVLMFYITTLALPDLGFISMGALLLGFILASFSIAATNGGIDPIRRRWSLPSRCIKYRKILVVLWMDYVGDTYHCDRFNRKVASLFYLPLYNRKLKKV